MSEFITVEETDQSRDNISIDVLLSKLLQLGIVLHPSIAGATVSESCEKLKLQMQWMETHSEIIITNDYQSGIRLVGSVKEGYILIFCNMLSDLISSGAPFFGILRPKKERKLIKLIKSTQKKAVTFE